MKLRLINKHMTKINCKTTHKSATTISKNSPTRGIIPQSVNLSPGLCWWLPINCSNVFEAMMFRRNEKRIHKTRIRGQTIAIRIITRRCNCWSFQSFSRTNRNLSCAKAQNISSQPNCMHGIRLNVIHRRTDLVVDK